MTVGLRTKRMREAQREKRHRRIRQKIWGTAERPRLVVHRSLRNTEGQLVNDDLGQTLLGLSTLDPEIRDLEAEGDNPKVEQAFAAGKLLAERASKEGVEKVVFDRGGYQYHGRVKAFAEGAREGGLDF